MQKSTEEKNSSSLKNKKIFVPQMSYEGAAAFAASLRSVGFNAEISPFSDKRTLELGGRYTSGDECYPLKITFGNFLKVIQDSGLKQHEIAFFMPTADGPCRFGQYTPFIKKMLKECGYEDIQIIAPTSENSYEGIGEYTNDILRTAWRALLCSDILRKLLLKTRPYEKNKGETDIVFENSLKAIEKVLETQNLSHPERINQLLLKMTEIRNNFRKIPVNRKNPRPLIGIIGEIYCRLDSFTNFDLMKKVEEYGGECWISDIGEWIFYSNSEQIDKTRFAEGFFSKNLLKAYIKNWVQKKEEHNFYSIFSEDFYGLEEPKSIKVIFDYCDKYLNVDGSNGEMILNIGKSIYLQTKGADGLIDISPFSCMNAIVSEAIYPNVSKDYDNIPIKNFYFDGTHSDLDRDIGIFMELAKNYMHNKTVKRVFPSI